MDNPHYGISAAHTIANLAFNGKLSSDWTQNPSGDLRLAIVKGIQGLTHIHGSLLIGEIEVVIVTQGWFSLRLCP